MRRWAVPAGPVRRGAGALAMLALAEAPAPVFTPILLFICPPGIWALLFICVLLLIWAPPPGCAPRMPALLFIVAPLFMVAPALAGGTVMVAPVLAPPATGAVAVWAPAAPAAMTRAKVSRVRCIRGPPPVCTPPCNARRGTDVPCVNSCLARFLPQAQRGPHKTGGSAWR